MQFQVTYRLTHPEYLPTLSQTTLSAQTHQQLDVTLTRFWRVGEEKFDTIDTGGFYEQISTDLYKRIQATSSSPMCAPAEKTRRK